MFDKTTFNIFIIMSENIVKLYQLNPELYDKVKAYDSLILDDGGTTYCFNTLVETNLYDSEFDNLYTDGWFIMNEVNIDYPNNPHIYIELEFRKDKDYFRITIYNEELDERKNFGNIYYTLMDNKLIPYHVNHED